MTPFSRRHVLAAGATALLAACSENPSTGRRQLVLASDEMLAELSAQAWRDALTKMPRAQDAGLRRTLERIGGRVAGVSDYADTAWEFVVFDSPEVNAFVLPGGKVGFYRGLMEFAQSEGEIAAVMGHEVGHVEARHAAERMSQQVLLSVGVAAASVVLSEEFGEHADDIAGALGMGVMYGVVLPYSRRHELEADALGVELMRKATYDPADAVGFWERMVANAAGRPKPPAWLSTHPADDTRLVQLRAAAAQG